MKTMQVGELKAKFSAVIEEVRNGEEVVISYGKKKENVAVIIPYSKFTQSNRIKLGILKGQAHVTFAKDFKMGPEELLNE